MYFFAREEHLDGKLDGDTLVACTTEFGAPCICLCSLEEVRRLVCRNAEREKLWLRLETFLVRTRAVERFSHLNLAGTFASNAERPREIEVYLQPRAPYGPEAFAAMEPLLELGLGEIYRRYRVRLRFWVKGAPTGQCGLRNAVVSAPSPGGIVRVPLHA